jgi:hypothetical protein
MYTIKDTADVCAIKDGVAVASGLGPRSPNYQCVSGRMRAGTMWLGIWAGVLIVVLMYYEVKAAIMYGVLFATIISWIPGGRGRGREGGRVGKGGREGGRVGKGGGGGGGRDEREGWQMATGRCLTEPSSTAGSRCVSMAQLHWDQQ